jgi:hypothetical protein
VSNRDFLSEIGLALAARVLDWTVPYEPGYVANKEADKRRKETKERLRQREREFAERQQPPLIVPERLRAVSVGGSSL